MANTDSFTQALNALNVQQKAAVEAIEGPVMVVAGPGTGKTEIIAIRIAYILKHTDTPADALLALTFTESGVTAIRKRLVKYIGKDGYDVHVHTFHSLSNTLIQQFPDEFPRITGNDHIDEVQRLKTLRSILSDTTFGELNPLSNVDYYVKKISGALRDLKREGFTPDDFEHVIKNQAKELEEIDDLYHTKGKYEGQMKGKYKTIERRIKKNRDLLLIYRAYEECLEEQHLYDFEDMVLEVLRELETNNDFLLALQESYLYILADEHQDANKSQNRLLFLLSSFYEEPNLFIVGDDKQAIYRFQGASLQNFLSFTHRFPNSAAIELQTNYRSTQRILDAAFRLISHNPTLSEKTLEATTANGGYLEASIYNTPHDETAAVALNIQKRIDEGVNPDEIAVLVRRNTDKDFYKRALFRKGIPLSVDENLEDNTFAKTILAYIRAVTKPHDNSLVAQALFSPFLNIDPRYLIAEFDRVRRKGELLVETKGNDKDSSKALETIAQLHAYSQHKDVLSTLENIFNDSGMVAYALAQQSMEYIHVLNTLFGIARSYVRSGSDGASLAGFITYIDTANEFGIELPRISNERGGVHIMTTHRSKGLEFNTVCIPQVDSLHWGKKTNRDFFYIPELKALSVSEEEDPVMDERRLFFVAMTRARSNLFLSYTHRSENGKEMLASPFLKETEIDVQEDTETHSHTLYEPAENISSSDVRDDFVTYIRERFYERGVTATGINAYLECPNKYIFRNLIRIPEAQSPNAQFGTIIHSVLQRVISQQPQNTSPEDYAVSLLRTMLNESGLEKKQIEQFAERGTTALEGYFKKYGVEATEKTETEKYIKTLLEVNDRSVPLSGMIDKLEIGHKNSALITDYKTGKVRSRNFIEGNTENSNGDYKRQLVFYSLLLDLSGIEMEKGVIDFVEPNERGYFKRHAFTVTSEEKDELIDVIRTLALSIEDASFVSASCGEDDCPWCELHAYAFSRNG